MNRPYETAADPVGNPLEPAPPATAELQPTGYDDLLAVLDALPVLVRETRRRKGQSLREAAAVTGCSFSTLSRCESRSGDPSLSSVVAILRWVAT